MAVLTPVNKFLFSIGPIKVEAIHFRYTTGDTYVSLIANPYFVAFYPNVNNVISSTTITGKVISFDEPISQTNDADAVALIFGV